MPQSTKECSGFQLAGLQASTKMITLTSYLDTTMSGGAPDTVQQNRHLAAPCVVLIQCAWYRPSGLGPPAVPAWKESPGSPDDPRPLRPEEQGVDGAGLLGPTRSLRSRKHASGVHTWELKSWRLVQWTLRRRRLRKTNSCNMMT